MIRSYQRLGVSFLTERKAAALVLKMSAGKTVITLTALLQLFCDLEIRGVLVVAPLRVCHLVWPAEIEKWEHLKNLRVSSITGSLKERLAALRTPADVYLINYENLIWLFDTLTKFTPYCKKDSKWPFDAIVFDELTRMKGYSAKRFKAYKRFINRFSYRWGLTGTIMPRDYFDLFSQYYCLDGGERLGTSYFSYRTRFFYPTDWNQYHWQLHRGAEETIRELITDITLEIDHDAGLPDVIEGKIYAEMSHKVTKMYKQLEKDMLLKLEDADITPLNKAALYGKCRQFANGAIYTGSSDKVWELIHDAKLDALDDILEETGPVPIIIYTAFQHDTARLKEYLRKKLGKEHTTTVVDIGELTSKPQLTRFILDWESGKTRFVLAHPGSAGHGLNLQFGGNTIIWFGPTDNLEHYLQANARLIRTGQEKTVAIYHILTRGTIDVPIFAATSRKDARQMDFMTALREYSKRNYLLHSDV